MIMEKNHSLPGTEIDFSLSIAYSLKEFLKKI